MTQELRRLAEAATKGPWIAAGPSYGDPMPRYYNAVVVETDDPLGDDDICRDTMTSEDALYIAAANPAAILSLLDRLEKAEKELSFLNGDLLYWTERAVGKGNANADIEEAWERYEAFQRAAMEASK